MAVAQSPVACQHPQRGLYPARVLQNEPVCREHLRLRLSVPDAFAISRPGQFIQLGCRKPDEPSLQGRELEILPGQRPALTQTELLHPLALLRRPFSLAGQGRSEKGQCWIEIIHRVVGIGTSWLSKLSVGDEVDLIGPLGNGFSLPDSKCLALLVGGGVGLPPMFHLAHRLKQAGWHAIALVGAMTADLLAARQVTGSSPANDFSPRLCLEPFASLGYPTAITTNDGSLGSRGLVTQALEKAIDGLTQAQQHQTVVFTCGPDAMMHAVAKLSLARGLACQVCLEQAMACGMGTCQSCIVKIEDQNNPQGTTLSGRPWRYRLTCTDGPVFDAAQLIL